MYCKQAIFALLFMLACLSCTKTNISSQNMRKDTPAFRAQPKLSVDKKGIQDAIDKAISDLYNVPGVFETEYVLTSAQQILVNNKWIWRVTFKPKELLPIDPSKDFIGLGGEVFVNVDLVTKDTVITYGE